LISLSKEAINQQEEEEQVGEVDQPYNQPAGGGGTARRS
jgi:hypothetical protein